MAFIHTTATAVEKLKQRAKQLRKASGTTIPLASFQDEVAKQAGYHHWKHVTVCLAKSTEIGKLAPSAPPPSCFEQFGHLMSDEERALYDRMLPAEQEFLLFQLEKSTPEGKARYQALDVSTTVVSRDAKRLTT
ncbi:hypothetical protein SAMN05518845_11581 [Variovorax sp. YR750]|uniref:hypothetical protein n=1 Tax=Variovorax sp. YR750 TaxID=1884384 RepID=UPI0008B622D3|nr:hypothetical protein [Variovorax sp. YR750]SEM04671.1 hypothetical protein SAMN05518845_11581 [Variovorax sp. YR750]